MKKILPLMLSLLGCQILAAQPNVILIVSDDAGYADFGFMNPVTGATTQMLTPELDAMRSQGTLFTKAYTGTVCSPSRGSILSGSYGQRVGYEHNISNYLGANEGPDGFANEDVIAFERMKEISGANYKTLAIGKWHVGAQDDTLSGGSVTVPGTRPPRQGVDHFFGLLGGSRPYATPMAANQLSREEKLLREMSPGATATDPASNSNEEDSGNWDGDITDAFGKRARQYVTAHANQSDPFFLYVAFTAPHGPLEQSADYAALSHSSHPNFANFTSMSEDRKKYYSMLYTMDRNIGLLMDRLEDPNNDGNSSDSIVDNTLVIFINDNGGATGSNTGLNLPLRGEKGSVYDGGCRVPMLMVGPSIPANATFDKPVHSMDLVPTMIGAGGNTVPAELMGTNLIPYVTGADSTDPHEYVLVRGVNKFGLRKGNYKLILEADGDQFLYDTSTDIGESTNIASSNPTILAEMLKDAANFDVQVDKPNFPGKGSPLDTYNYNYGFTFNPDNNTTSGGVDLVLIDYNDGNGGNGVHDSEVNNGGFETNTATSGSNGKFDQVSFWTNLAGNQNTNAIKDDAVNQSPDGGGWMAVVVDTLVRDFGIDTGHFLTNGESFECSYDWLDASNWASSDRIRFQLFTTDTNSITGARTAIATVDSSSSTNQAYKSESFTFNYSGVTGKKLFLRFHALDGDGNPSGSGFARVDNVYLGRLDSGSSQASPQFWATNNKWDETGSSVNETLLDTDSCALGTLVFPAKSGFDYIAENNLNRPTGPEFIQNTLRTEGTGSGGKIATISGNSVLLAEDFLSGKAPTLDLSGNGTNYTFEFALDLLLYHDAVVKGNGTANYLMSGELKDYEHPAALTKQGTSKLTLAHDASYTGITTITGGTLETNPGVTLAGSPQVIVQAGGTLGGNGTVTGDVSGSGTIAPGQSIGTLNLGGNAQAGTLRIEIDAASADRVNVAGTLNAAATNLTFDVLATPVQNAYIIASYGSLTGSFSSVTGLPAGYTLNYAFNDGGSSNHIALVVSGPGDTDPPTPNPATFGSAPAADSDTAISMTATTGSDASGPVEYLFTETTGNPGATSSGWQTSASYTDTGLSAGTLYSYTVTMRDSLGNTGTASAGASATTSGGGGPIAVVGVTGHDGGNWPATLGHLSDMVNALNPNLIPTADPDMGMNTSADPSDPATWTYSGGTWQQEWLANSRLDSSTSSNNKIGWVVLDLGSVTASLAQLFLWNNTATGAGEYTNTYNVYYADSPTAALPAMPNSQSTTGDYDFSSGGWTLFNTGGALTLPHNTASNKTPEAIIALGGISARYIGLEILTAGDGTAPGRVGLAQVEITAGSGSPAITVPDVTGLSQSAAESAITATSLTVGTVTTSSSGSVPAGNVISQTPTGGTSASSGAAVNLVVSTGPPLVTVPDVVGLSQSAAQSAITAAGLTVGSVATEFSASVSADDVISQGLTAGASVPAGSAVNLVVSLGEEPDTDPPTPNPAGFAVAPAADSDTAISMTATTATDPSGVEYSFTETSGNPGANDSGWQDSPSYSDTGLTSGTQYTYTVTVRDKSPNQNITTASAAASATTTDTPYATWAVANGITGGFGDDDDGDGTPNGHEWYFSNGNAQITGLTETGPGAFEFAHVRPKDRTDVTETYQWSSDLLAWQTADGSATDGTNTVNVADKTVAAGPTANHETVTLEATIGGPEVPALFFRLGLSNP